MENMIQDPRLLPHNDLKENTSMNSVIFQQVQPVAPLSRTTQQIEFQVPANSNGLIDLAGSYITSGAELYYTANAVPPLTQLAGASYIPPAVNGSQDAWANSVSFKEFLGSTLFRDVKIYLNGVEVNDVHPQLSSQSAFYKRLLQDKGNNGNGFTYCAPTLGVETISVGNDTAEVDFSMKARTNGWKGAEGADYCSNIGAMRNIQQGTAGTKGAVSKDYSSIRTLGMMRLSFTKATPATPYEVLTKLQDGINNQSAFLPANVDIRVVLTLNTHEQVVYNNDPVNRPIGYSLVNSTLWIKRGFPTPSAMAVFNRRLADAPLSYPLTMTKATMRSITAGSATINETNLLNGVVPDRVLIAFKDKGALTTGDHRFSQYISTGVQGAGVGDDTGNLYQNVITSLYVNANGRQYPQRQYDLGFNTSKNNSVNNIRPYMDYVNTWSSHNDVFPDDTPPISYEAWCSNYKVFVVDLRDDGLNENGLTTDLNNRGSIEVVATQQNSSGTVVAVEMFVMGIYNAEVIIDANRNVSKVGF